MPLVAPAPLPLSSPTSSTSSLDALVALLRGRRVAALTGAGCSTESGIPDYRSPEAQQRTRTPIQGPEFVRSAAVRQRYWARSVLGWERFRHAAPNTAHHAFASLERDGVITGLITQNVDRLHHAAGSTRVVELHGALAEVQCLACAAVEPREAVQARLLELNPGWRDLAAEAAPDGDADLPAEHLARFRVGGCLRCAGVLKPRVVFFGDNVARPVVDAAYAMVDAADTLLVVGSSLTVFSGYRFLRRAVERGIPVAIVNRGPVRGEEAAAVKLEERIGLVLPHLAAALRSAHG